MGYSRQQFCEIQSNYQTYRAEGLIDRLLASRGPHPKRSHRRRPVLPHRWPQPACRHRHLLEHAEVRRWDPGPREDRHRLPRRVPYPRLAPRVRAHQPDRRKPAAGYRTAGAAKTLNVAFRPLPRTTSVNGALAAIPFLRGEHRRLAFLDHMLRAPHRARRIERQDLADHQPVEQHPDRRQVLLHARRRQRPRELLYVGRDHHRLDLRQGDAVVPAPVGEPPRRDQVGTPRVRVANVAGEFSQNFRCACSVAPNSAGVIPRAIRAGIELPSRPSTMIRTSSMERAYTVSGSS